MWTALILVVGVTYKPDIADIRESAALRVMGEAYLATTRKRVSLARHARLVDYLERERNAL